MSLAEMLRVRSPRAVLAEIRRRCRPEPLPEPQDPWPMAWPAHPLYAETVFLPCIGVTS